MTGMKKPIMLSTRIGLLSVSSLAFSILSCIGCSVYEHNRWGQAQDGTTFLLAGGTYLSLLAFLVSGVLFVIVLAMEKLGKISN
jgi:hypothetical protein